VQEIDEELGKRGIKTDLLWKTYENNLQGAWK
jgi:hypothetical protein